MSKTVKTQISADIVKNAMTTFYGIYGFERLGDLFDIVAGKGFTNWFVNLFNKASESINSLRAYPIKLDSLGFQNYQDTTKIGGKPWNIRTYLHKGYIFNQKIASYDFTNPSSFIDLEPYTQIQLYIPYMEFIDLPVNEIVGKTLEVYYAVDISTGIATATLQVTDGKTNYVIASKSNKVGVDIAWGRDNSIENSRNVLNTIVSTAVTVVALYASKGTSALASATQKIGTATALAKGTLSVANSLQSKYERGGSAGSMGNLFAPNSVYLIIKKPKLVPVDEEDYAHTYGKPLYESRVLTQLSGYTVVDEIHLTGFPDALDGEIEEIERLLKEGVHF